MKIVEGIELKWNLEIDMYDRGKRKRVHSRTHNIVVDTGRQMILENITPATLFSGGFTRTQNTVVRYIGFGLGGTRQTGPNAGLSPYADAYPAGYAGANAQTDNDVTVAQLERPVAVSAAPLFMKEISTPGTFDYTTAQKSTFIATFDRADINYGGFLSMPLSEIGLYKSSADPALPNGGAGAYPGGTGHLIAYDTFDTIHKTGGYAITVRWTFSL
jgi:hypothetical protein